MERKRSCAENVVVFALLLILAIVSIIIVHGSIVRILTPEINEIKVVNEGEDISEIEYGALVQRIDKLEQLKASKINKNLSDFYGNASSEISMITNTTAWAIAILTGITAGLVFFNFSSSKKTIDEGNELIDTYNTTLNEINKKSEELENKINHFEVTKKQLEIYTKRMLIQTINNDDASVTILEKLIKESKEKGALDCGLYFQHATIVLKQVDSTPEIEKNKLIKLAKEDLEEYIKLSDIKDDKEMIELARIKLIYCLINLHEYSGVFNELKYLSEIEYGMNELTDTLVEFIIANKQEGINLLNPAFVNENLLKNICNTLISKPDEIVLDDFEKLNKKLGNTHLMNPIESELVSDLLKDLDSTIEVLEKTKKIAGKDFKNWNINTSNMFEYILSKYKGTALFKLIWNMQPDEREKIKLKLDDICQIIGIDE